MRERSLEASSGFHKFENVESPYQILRNLTNNTYNWKQWDEDADVIQGNAWIIDLDGPRREVLKARDGILSRILENPKKDWLALYTGHNEFDLTLTACSTWHVEEKEKSEAKSVKALSIYRDEHTGFTMIIRGPIQVVVPTTSGGVAYIYLENNLSAFEKNSNVKRKIHFHVTFSNYTLMFCISTINKDWIIQKIKITNEDGDSMNLMAKTKILMPEHKCIDQFYEFQSLKQPSIAVKIAKYKFFRLPIYEDNCTSPYNFHVMSSFMFLSIATVSIFWDSLLKNQNFKTKTKIFKLSPETFFSVDENNQII